MIDKKVLEDWIEQTRYERDELGKQSDYLMKLHEAHTTLLSYLVDILRQEERIGYIREKKQEEGS